MSDSRKTVLILISIALFILLINVALAFSYHEIMGVAAILVTLFIGSFQVRVFVLTLKRVAVHHYHKRRYSTFAYYVGTEIPTALAIPSGIILLILTTGSIPVTDWAYLNMTSINIVNILWYINAVLALVAGIIGARIWKAPEPEDSRLDVYHS